MKKIEMTLAYFIQENKILLPLKKRKIGKGKHNGVGGKLEENESHEQAMIRECQEEVGLTPTDYEYMAKISFNELMDGERSIAIVHIYTCKEWTGELIETDEMKPYWFDINNIPYDKMIDEDKYWLPLVLDGKKIIANFDYDENNVILGQNIEEIEELLPKNKKYI